MFKKLVETIKNIGSHRTVFDPSRINDAVALQTEWRPLRGGGSNFKTHKLAEINFHRIEFKATVFSKIFSMIFLFTGLAVFFFFGLKEVDLNNPSFRFEIIFPVGFGLIFTAIGIFMFNLFTKPIVFDKTYGYFWKGRKQPAQTYDYGKKKNSIPLSEIHALQIISEYVSGSKSSYFSYELNLILKDGRRMNVIDHGKIAALREDAQKLAGFLGIPVWDSLL